MRALVIAGAFVAVCSASVAQGNVVTNGNFEATPFDSGWSSFIGTPSVSAGAGLVSGSNTAAYLKSTNAVTVWTPTITGPTGPQWSFEMLFASEAIGADGGSTSSNRLLQLSLQHQPEVAPNGGGEGQINLAITDTGTVTVFSGSSTANNVITGMALLPTIDANNNNSFNDVGDTKRVYKLIVNGDYSSVASTGRYYGVSVVDVATGLTLGSASDLKFFQYQLPGAGGASLGVHSVEIVSNITSSTFAVDNIWLSDTSAVPEPATAGLILGGVAMLARRRRSANAAK